MQPGFRRVLYNGANIGAATHQGFDVRVLQRKSFPPAPRFITFYFLIENIGLESPLARACQLTHQLNKKEHQNQSMRAEKDHLRKGV
jgi:cell division protein FtsB